MSKHKVKAHFTHKGKSYKPGEEFESEDQHEVQTLANQGHIDHQEAGAQQQGQAQQAQGADPSKQGSDPSKQGR